MKKTILMTIALLCLVVQGAWAWNGSGTSADPYKIQTSADWKQLSNEVLGGNGFSGLFFEMTADIDAEGISIGSESKHFSGTFDGGGHTLTYNRGASNQPVNELCAPFISLDGATIRHFKVTGAVYSSHKFAAGIASLVDGTKATTIYDCHVSSLLWADRAVISDATFGGLVGAVNEDCTQSLQVKNTRSPAKSPSMPLAVRAWWATRSRCQSTSITVSSTR